MTRSSLVERDTARSTLHDIAAADTAPQPRHCTGLGPGGGCRTRRRQLFVQKCSARAISVFLLTLMFSFNSSYSQELFSSDHVQYSPQFVENYLNPQVFAQLDIQSDETGPYVQIDDMRFAVDEMRTLAYTGRTWLEGLFVYEFSPELDKALYYKAMFEQACQEVSSHASLTCMERSNAPTTRRNDYVFVRNDSEGNFSYVGMRGGKQIMGIKDWHRGIIMHEILHSLGWVHEHSRQDRYKFVSVNWSNIIPNKKHNFYIDSNAISGFSYDFGSIMHYPPRAFLDKKAGKAGKTLEAKPPYTDRERLMGSLTLSDTDIREIAHEYGKPGSEWCQYDPWYDPPEICRCKSDGWCCDGDPFCRFDQ